MNSNLSTQQATCNTVVQGCVAAAAAIIGTKWTPQLIYALASGVTRFSALQKEAGGINPRTLSARLDELEAQGIVHKQQYAEMPPRIEYSLTQKGIDLIPILERMVEWSEKHGPKPEALLTAMDEQTGEHTL